MLLQGTVTKGQRPKIPVRVFHTAVTQSTCLETLVSHMLVTFLSMTSCCFFQISQVVVRENISKMHFVWCRFSPWLWSVSWSGQRWCEKIPSLNIPFLSWILCWPSHKGFPLSSQVSAVYFPLLLEALMPKLGVFVFLFFQNIHETKWFCKPDQVFLESWTESSKYSWGTGLIQMASSRLYSPRFFLLSAIYFRGTQAAIANQMACLQGFLG